MNKKEKKSPNVLIRVKAEHAYSEVGNKNYEVRWINRRAGLPNK